MVDVHACTVLRCGWRNSASNDMYRYVQVTDTWAELTLLDINYLHKVWRN